MKNKHIETCEADDLDLSRAIEFAKELGRRGGLATLKKRGKAHYKKMNEASQRAYKLKKAKLKPPIIVTKKSPNNLTQYNLNGSSPLLLCPLVDAIFPISAVAR